MVRENGLVHVYTGDGKGKTTCALGLSMRAWGNGRKVCFIQFMKKGENYGEVKAMDNCPGIDHFQYGSGDFVYKGKVKEEDLRQAQEGLKHAQEATRSGEYDMVVLDEIVITMFFDVFPEEDVLDIIRQKHPRVELVLTGRRAPQSIMDAADYVTEMMARKHPYDRGVMARKGVEF
ncbi:MAG: cob(I)yrinic acid a,c-diamide adenosyltransferase [Candidatus Methanomethylophilaceae archaeon]|nr:cob(I)yrinic acid a,c-diamide adenosyltransferase [Candidatus Methanomethylophilaceae archaeon]